MFVVNPSIFRSVQAPWWLISFVEIFQIAKNGQLQPVGNGETQTCGGSCGAEQCALCRGDADTDNKQNIVSCYSYYCTRTLRWWQRTVHLMVPVAYRRLQLQKHCKCVAVFTLYQGLWPPFTAETQHCMRTILCACDFL